MPKQSCKCGGECQKLRDIEHINNPKPKLLKRKGFFYHIRVMLKPDEDCLLDLWVDSSLASVVDSDELGQDLIQAIQRVMDKHTDAAPVGTC